MEKEGKSEREREANTFRLPIEYEQKREEEEVVPSSLPSLRYENVSVILTHAVEHQQPHPPLQTNTATFCVSMKMCVIPLSLSHTLTLTLSHTHTLARSQRSLFFCSLFTICRSLRGRRGPSGLVKNGHARDITRLWCILPACVSLSPNSYISILPILLTFYPCTWPSNLCE